MISEYLLFGLFAFKLVSIKQKKIVAKITYLDRRNMFTAYQNIELNNSDHLSMKLFEQIDFGIQQDNY